MLPLVRKIFLNDEQEDNCPSDTAHRVAAWFENHDVPQSYSEYVRYVGRKIAVLTFSY